MKAQTLREARRGEERGGKGGGEAEVNGVRTAESRCASVRATHRGARRYMAAELVVAVVAVEQEQEERAALNVGASSLPPSPAFPRARLKKGQASTRASGSRGAPHAAEEDEAGGAEGQARVGQIAASRARGGGPGVAVARGRARFRASPLCERRYALLWVHALDSREGLATGQRSGEVGSTGQNARLELSTFSAFERAREVQSATMPSLTDAIPDYSDECTTGPCEREEERRNRAKGKVKGRKRGGDDEAQARDHWWSWSTCCT